MCGRFNEYADPADVTRSFRAKITGEWQLPIRYNITPNQKKANVVVVRLIEGERQFSLACWGLIPSWSPEPKTNYSTSLARADTIATKPTYRSAYKHRRCLVPATGYYEWETIGKKKLPYLYEVGGPGQLFALAGIWESWNKGDGPPVESFSIVTTEPNELCSKVIDRMPVILEPGDYDAWLDPELKDPAYLLTQLPAEKMTARRVSTYMNTSGNEGPECLAPPELDADEAFRLSV